MKTVKIGLAVLLLLAASAAAAFPWYLGLRTERGFHAALEQGVLRDIGLGGGSPLSVSLVRYERGWLHSTAVHRVALKADPEVSFEVHHAIRHVPDPKRGFVVVESTPRWSEKVQSAADYYFGGKPAISVHSVMDFDRVLSMTLESPAFSKPLLTEPGVTLSWGGASGEVSLQGPARVALALELPRVEIDGGGVKAVFAGVDLAGDWTVAGNQAEWSGETRLAVGEMSFASPMGRGSLKGVETSMVQRNQGETVMVGYLFKVREGSASDPGAQPQGFQDAVLDLELDRLDKKTLTKYFDDLSGAQQTQISPEAHSRLAMQLALGMVQSMLKASPELRVKRLGLQTANGTLAGSAVLSFDGAGMAQTIAPADMVSRVKFTGSAEISGTLLRSWMVKQARAQAASALAHDSAPAEESQVQMLTQQLIQQQLAALEASGLLKAEADKFVVRAEFAAGRLSINGIAGDRFLPGLLPALLPKSEDSET
jgi:uncharacterized protein YdgA (DUF945 family)